MEIPSPQEVRDAMRHLTIKQIRGIAELSGVPADTIYKIKRGETRNPGIDTLRRFLPLVPPPPAAAGSQLAAVAARAMDAPELLAETPPSTPAQPTPTERVEADSPVALGGAVGCPAD